MGDGDVWMWRVCNQGKEFEVSSLGQWRLMRQKPKTRRLKGEEVRVEPGECSQGEVAFVESWQLQTQVGAPVGQVRALQENIKGRTCGVPGWEPGLMAGDNIGIRVERCPWNRVEEFQKVTLWTAAPDTAEWWTWMRPERGLGIAHLLFPWGPLGESDWEELKKWKQKQGDASQLRVFLAHLGRTPHQLEHEALKLYFLFLFELWDY